MVKDLKSIFHISNHLTLNIYEPEVDLTFSKNIVDIVIEGSLSAGKLSAVTTVSFKCEFSLATKLEIMRGG